MKRFWTTKEVAIVRELYPAGGVDACLAVLTRPRSAIYQKAAAMKLRAPGVTGVRESWPNDPEIDRQLRLLHEQPLLNGAIVEFARLVRRPVWYVSRRARELGLKTPRFKEEPWSEAEIELLHKTAHIGTANARGAFLRAGFNRSETAIHVKRKRERISVPLAKNDAGIYNANQLAELLGVDRKTVTRWISMDGLRAEREGDFWLVTEAHLRDFIVTHPLRVELRKIPDSNRVWFIELVAGRAGLSSEKVMREAA